CNKSFFQHNEKHFKCSVFCNKSFSQKTSLNNYLLVHSNEKHFKCSVCNKSFFR
ncbi:hypothetical protein L9F63_025355, partial [Diploptera punctata]